jgi:hypothetical protein
MYYAQIKREMPTKFWSENLNERAHTEELIVDVKWRGMDHRDIV